MDNKMLSIAWVDVEDWVFKIWGIMHSPMLNSGMQASLLYSDNEEIIKLLIYPTLTFDPPAAWLLG